MHNSGWDHYHSKEESVSHLELLFIISAASTSGTDETSSTESGTEAADEVTDAAPEQTQEENDAGENADNEVAEGSIIDKGKTG